MGTLEKSPDIRYLTYYLFFPSKPGVTDYWIQQKPFIHDLQFEIRNWTGINKDPKKVRDLLTKGETHWKDRRGVEHRIVIEKEQRETNWGIKR